MREREPDVDLDDPQDDEAGGATRVEPEWQRQRRLAEIFGDVVPDTTRDERGSGSGGTPRRGEDPGDRWLREQVPPHHG